MALVDVTILGLADRTVRVPKLTLLRTVSLVLGALRRLKLYLCHAPALFKQVQEPTSLLLHFILVSVTDYRYGSNFADIFHAIIRTLQ